MENSVLKLFDLKNPLPRVAILAVLFLLSLLFEQAKPVPAARLTDSAVLQQQKPIPVCVKAAGVNDPAGLLPAVELQTAFGH